MSIDVIGNFLTEIRNAILVSKRALETPFSNMKMGIAQVLKDEGFIKDYEKLEGEGNKHLLRVQLKYVDGESVIHVIKRVSTPGRRHYESLNKIEPVIGGLGISILSTNAGIVTDKKAKKLLVGGEVLCHVW
jgi:small subunit ribosomal protein S8